MKKQLNRTGKSILANSITASVGLILFGFGVYLTIQANIGVGPWDVFCIGLSKTFPLSYGMCSILISVVILGIDIALREKIGIGMFLDAVLVGKSVDLFNSLDLVPMQSKLYISIPIMILGLFIQGFSQYLYMKSALGCGPRDSMLVGLTRKLKKVPIGVINIIEHCIVTFLGWLLGGPVGIGTLICAFLTGPIMQIVFSALHFRPEKVEHQDIIRSFGVIFRAKSGENR